MNTASMQPLRFVVEHTILLRGSRYVFARRVDAGDFRLRDGLRLAGYEVHAFDMPRALAADGSARLDLFAFGLAPEDGETLRPGEMVLLTGTAAGSAELA